MTNEIYGRGVCELHGSYSLTTEGCPTCRSKEAAAALEEACKDVEIEQLKAAIAKWHGAVASHQYCPCSDCKTLRDIAEPPEGE